MSTIQQLSMTRTQIDTLVACMLSVAQVDGISPEEDSLIKKFYFDSNPTLAFEQIEQELCPLADALLPEARTEGNADEYAESVILMCLMTGYADGKLTPAELAHIRHLAAAAAVSDARVDELSIQVKDSLIGSLAHLPDSESVAALAKTL